MVDDEPPILKLLTYHLEKAGYQTLAATDGEAALVLAITEKPDLIVLDVSMPQMDGMQTCAKLRTNPITNHIPVLFLTVLNSSDRLDQAMDMGANDFLGKPIDIVEVQVRIQALLETKNIADPVQRHEQYIRTMNALRAKAPAV